MREHRVACGVVHLGLEAVLFLQAERPNGGGPCADLTEVALQVGELLHRVGTQHIGSDQARPAPHRHVDDAVGLVAHVLVLAQPRLEDSPVALRLERVAVHRVVLGPGRKDYAVNRYTFEAQRHWGILEARLGKHKYMCNETYSIVDMAVWGWSRLIAPNVLGPDAMKQFPNLARHLGEISARPAAVRALALK